VRLFGAGSDEWRTVVGVATNIAQNDRLRQSVEPVVYVPFRQQPSRAMFVVARTRVPPETLINEWRRQVSELDSQLFTTPRPLASLLNDAYQYRGTTGGMFLVCAAMALLLAAVGLYTVTMDSVSRRVKEMGVRVAVGATPADISRLIARQGFVRLALGLAIGVPASLAVNRMLANTLVQVSAADPATYVAVCLLLSLATALGCWTPARRAMRIDPVVALRSQ
jgi:putative ABC transport system permease protein